MRNFFHNRLRTLLVLTLVLGLAPVAFAQTKPRLKRRTTTARRVVPLVPVGTDLKVRINDTLSSKDSRIGDRFTATVLNPTRFDEAKLHGHISSIQNSGKIKGRTSMNLAFDSVELRDVVSDGAVTTGRIDGDREHPVFVGFEEELEGSPVALLASFDNPSIDKLFSHHHQCLDAGRYSILPIKT